jgi:hypothetical protein
MMDELLDLYLRSPGSRSITKPPYLSPLDVETLDTLKKGWNCCTPAPPKSRPSCLSKVGKATHRTARTVEPLVLLTKLLAARSLPNILRFDAVAGVTVRVVVVHGRANGVPRALPLKAPAVSLS